MVGNHSVILFYSTSAAIKAEKLIQNTGFTAKLMPVPRHLSSDCGVCLRFENKDSERIQGILEKERIEYNSIYQI